MEVSILPLLSALSLVKVPPNPFLSMGIHHPQPNLVQLSCLIFPFHGDTLPKIPQEAVAPCAEECKMERTNR